MYGEIVGPIPNGTLQPHYAVFVFDKNGKKIGEIWPITKDEAEFVYEQLFNVS